MKRGAAPRRRGGQGAVRIDDVARLAGVSAITVSRALNKPEMVTEPTRKAVQEAIGQLGYISNRLAGNLASDYTRTVGVVIPSLVSNIFADSVRGMIDVLRDAGYQLLLGVAQDSPETEMTYVNSFLGQRVDGIILTGGMHEKRTRLMLMQSGIPVVETNAVLTEPIDMAVGYSNEEASYAMTRYLARCGYRRIGIVTPMLRNNDRAQGRKAGYLRAVRDFDLVQDDSLLGESALHISHGAKMLREMLASNPDLEAVFFAHDMLAAGAMFEAARRGLRVPEDIGVAGFDDLDIAQEFVPPLTTVRTPRYTMGSTAAWMLLQRIRGETPPSLVVDVGFEIVPRESTRPPPE